MVKYNENVQPGMKFDKLTVIERLKGSNGKVLCKCDCGTSYAAIVTSLVNGLAKSCGCLIVARSKRTAITKKGTRHGRLVVIKRIVRNGKLTNKVLCQCDCGNKSKTNIDGLVYGTASSCGCINREGTAKRNKDTAKFRSFCTKHKRTYAAWNSMKSRCLNPKQKSYEYYGAKGVKICEWLTESPWNLLKLVGERPEGKNNSLDRFPIHDGHYTCGKCKECIVNGWKLNIRWATRKEQSLNRGDFNVYITAFGETMTKSKWMEKSGLGWSCITGRLRRGWGPEKALTTPDTLGNHYRPVV